MTKKPAGKWELRLWETPRPNYNSQGPGKGYPGQLFRRDYPNRSALQRALAPATRAHPTAQLAEIHYFSNEGWCWMQRSSESRYRCPHGDGWLVWAEDQWICPKCRDEWVDETIRPWLEQDGRLT